MRRPRAIYALTLVTVAAALLAGVKLAYDRGEISHATLHSVDRAPTDVPLVGALVGDVHLTARVAMRVEAPTVSVKKR